MEGGCLQASLRTLNIGDGLSKDVLLSLLVLEAREDLLLNGADELLLLGLALLSFVADPAVESSLNLAC